MNSRHSLALAPTDSPALSFEVASFGELDIPNHPIKFGFQVDIVPSSIRSQIIFGLVAEVNGDAGLERGFAVRLDLQHGEIWDVVNDSGLIGWMDHPYGLSTYTDEEPLLLSIEIEVAGKAMIPRIEIGGEEWLYPSLPWLPNLKLCAIAGCEGEDENPHGLFMHPALWRERPGA
jgi:hypothetical protein